jgi:tetratricopeptide (TPR) repeat protein/TolB-like protein
MGEVYRARDARLGRDIALKILSPELSASGDHLRRFEQEARAASALNHPNIITIYDIGRVDSVAYIAMELVEGQDLRTLIGGQPLPLKQALRIAVKVADGLAAAHERGIVHRDLKPENLMVSRDGFVKILDFGLAKLARPFTERDSTIPHTTPGAVFGTVGYMSPEQAAGREMDKHSDQFSLGVILYEMLTGRMPFAENSPAETLAAIIRNEPKPIGGLNDKIPLDLERVVMRLLSKEPQERYASTRDLARDLRELRDRISNTSGSPHLSGENVVPRQRRGLVAAAVAALAVAAAVVMYVRRDDRPPATTAGRGIVAVLPFAARTGGADAQVFADGVAEVISTRLEQSDVQVVKMFGVTGAASEVLRRARGRGAGKAVSGEVDRAGGRLAITYSVVDTASGRVLATNTVRGEGDLLHHEARLVSSIRQSLSLDPAPEAPATGELLSAADHNAYVDALGLLQRARDEKSIDRAIDILGKLLLNARDSAQVNAQLARAYLYKSQLSRRPELVEQATLYAERAAELDPSDPEVHLRLGQLRLESGRHRDAENEFRRVLTLRRNDPDATLGLAVAHEKMGRAADAERMFQQAIALRPDHGPTYNVYAVFLFQSGRYEDAAKNFRRFATLMPTARGLTNLGESYRALGRYEDAERALRESIALEQTTDGYHSLGDVCYYTGRFAEARQSYQASLAVSPGNHRAWLGLANALRHSGAPRNEWTEAYAQAAKAGQGAIAVNSRDAAAHAVTAIALAALGRTSEAAAASQTALKIDPTDETALYAAAVVAQERGAGSAAMSWLDGAVRNGYPVNDLMRDPIFRSERNNPSFVRAVQQQQK